MANLFSKIVYGTIAASMLAATVASAVHADEQVELKLWANGQEVIWHESQDKTNQCDPETVSDIWNRLFKASYDFQNYDFHGHNIERKTTDFPAKDVNNEYEGAYVWYEVDMGENLPSLPLQTWQSCTNLGDGQ